MGRVTEKLSIGILGASFETNNFGVAALACGAIAAIIRSRPDAQILMVDYATHGCTYHVRHSEGLAPVELLNIRFSKYFYHRNNIARLLVEALCYRLLPINHLRKRIHRNNKVLKAIIDADLLASIAGGDSFSDIYGLTRLIYVALPQILVLVIKKPLVLLPQTIGPFKRAFSKVIARNILCRALKVFCRDIEGLDPVRKLIGSNLKRLNFCHDMGFVMLPAISESRKPCWMSGVKGGAELIGFNVSGLLYMGGYTRDNMFRLKADYRKLIFDIISYFIEKHKARIVLVPHVFGTDDAGESDVAACLKVYADIKPEYHLNIHVIGETYDQHEIKGLIGECNFFLGSRMHACIGALSQCLPAVGLAYSDKFNGVFNAIGMEGLVADLRIHDNRRVVAIVDELYRKRSAIQQELETKVPRIRESIFSTFTQLLSEVDSRGYRN